MRTVIVLILAVVAICQAQLTVDTPTNVVTCQFTRLTWSEGAANDTYTLVISSNTVTASATGINTPYLNWLVNFPPNTQLHIEVAPSSIAQFAKSGFFTVQAGDNQTCVVYPPASTPADSSSSTSTSFVSSGSITGTSGLSTSQRNSTSTLLPLPLLSLTGTGTSSDPTGVSGPSLGDTSPPSSSPNVGLVAGAAVGCSVAFILLLLGVCLYRRRRKRSAEVVEQFHPFETKAEETPPFTRHHPTYYSTIPMVKQYPSTDSHEFSALANQRLHSERRISSGTAVPLMTPGHNIAVALATNTTTTTPRYDTASSSATSEPIEDPPPVYRDEAEALIQSQRIRAEEAERVRRYDALIAGFCASNRDLISPALERKLHAARHLPDDNPSDLTADYWLTTYGVEPLELGRLQAAYDRRVTA